jgi:hypothetical protein
MKKNCWDFLNCGRTAGGPKEAELGACPVSTYAELNGIHGGFNAGRACWVVAGSLCGGRIQGDAEQKKNVCWECEFLKMVRKEEEPQEYGFSHTRLGMDRVLIRKKGQLGR